MVDDLFALDLTVYSSGYSFDSILYNALATSELDENISLHPRQLNIVSMICENDALIVSAPTSFGKTFSIFEYIVRYGPQNIVLVVPTLALVDEYYKRIIKNININLVNIKYILILLKIKNMILIEKYFCFNS